MAAADRHAAKLESRWLRPDEYVMDEFDCYAPSREFAFYLVFDATCQEFKSYNAWNPCLVKLRELGPSLPW